MSDSLDDWPTRPCKIIQHNNAVFSCTAESDGKLDPISFLMLAALSVLRDDDDDSILTAKIVLHSDLQTGICEEYRPGESQYYTIRSVKCS